VNLDRITGPRHESIYARTDAATTRHTHTHTRAVRFDSHPSPPMLLLRFSVRARTCQCHRCAAVCSVDSGTWCCARAMGGTDFESAGGSEPVDRTTCFDRASSSFHFPSSEAERPVPSVCVLLSHRAWPKGRVIRLGPDQKQ
jgi:hypothetical protein